MDDERARRPVDAVPAGPGPDADAVARAFGLGPPSAATVFAARGELGRIYLLDTDRGTWAVKQLLQHPDADAVAIDVALQQRSIEAGVTAPHPVLTPEGEALTVVDGASIRVHTWVDLLPGPVSADHVTAAAQLGRMHSVAVADEAPVDPWFRAPVADVRFAELGRAAQEGGEPWAALLDQRLPDLAATTGVVEELDTTAPTHVCHCDVNPQNVLVAGSGDGVVLDWENAGSFWLACELASTLAEFEVPTDSVATFLAAYQDNGGPARIEDRSAFAGILAVQAHLIEHYAEAALDPSAAEEERQRARFWLDDILRHLFTVERVEAWTAATG